MSKSNNKTRDPGARERWNQAKREDRPKQTWVWDQVEEHIGHWKHTYWHPASEQPISSGGKVGPEAATL